MEKKNPQANLPPGFRFHPTDEELVLHYLRKKVMSSPVPVSIIADVDIYKFDPWDLPAKAPFGEKEWYFFSPRDRKYPNGIRPNRAAASGYWKATGTDKSIATTIAGGLQENIGVKKALVFYKGRPPKGMKTNWIMHEYRLTENFNSKRNNFTNDRALRSKESSMRLDDWVLCRIYNKTNSSASSHAATSDQERDEQEQFITQESRLPNTTSCFPQATLKPQKSCSFSNLMDAADLSTLLSSFLSENPTNQTVFEFPSTVNCATSDQPVLYNFGYVSSGGDNGCLGQKLPELSSSSPAKTENDVTKRQRLIFDENTISPSKKIGTFCCNDNTIDLSDHGMGYRYSF